jgi:hypothetical protein
MDRDPHVPRRRWPLLVVGGDDDRGVRAHLLDVYVQQSLLGIDYALLRGESAEGDALSERVSL